MAASGKKMLKSQFNESMYREDCKKIEDVVAGKRNIAELDDYSVKVKNMIESNRDYVEFDDLDL